MKTPFVDSGSRENIGLRSLNRSARVEGQLRKVNDVHICVRLLIYVASKRRECSYRFTLPTY